MVEAVLRARGPYSLRLTTGTTTWSTRLAEQRWATAHQLSDGRVVVRASCEHAVDEARFLLALDDDTERVPPPACARPAPRPDGAAAAWDADAAQGDRDARRDPRRLGTTHPGEQSARDRALDHQGVRSGSADARCARGALPRAAHGVRPRLEQVRRALAPREDDRSGETARARGCPRQARARTRRRPMDGRRDRPPGPRPVRRRARGRSRAREAARVASRGGGPAPARQPRSSRRTASGRGSRASFSYRGSSAASCPGRAPTAPGTYARPRGNAA